MASKRKGKGKPHARRNRLAVRTKRRVAKRHATKATPRKRAQRQANGRRDWRPRFLKTLRNTGVVGMAARAAGITRQHAYRVAKQQPEFRAEWEEVEEAALDKLEASAMRRAEKDRVLTIFILKSKRRSVYGDRPTGPAIPHVLMDNIPENSPGNPA